MQDDTALCNVALSHCGISKEIANVETERSGEASACRRFLTPVREEVFRDMKPPFATQIVSLALIEEDPNDEWAFSYRLPANCMAFQRILSGIRNDTRQTRIPYKIAKDAQGKLLFTDKEDAQGEFIGLVTDVNLYPPDVAMAMSLLLAAYIAPRVTGGDPFKLGDKAFKTYVFSYAKARINGLNEQQDEENPESEFIKARS